MKKVVFGLITAALSLGAAAQDVEPVAFKRAAFPFQGEVKVSRLNVRLFPKTDQSSIIASVLKQGEKVTVIGEKEGFFQILPTRGCTAWVSSRSVERDGTVGTVFRTGVPVRLDSRINADAVGTLDMGATVEVLGEHLGWLKIVAPHTVKYFVGKRYILEGEAVDPSELPAGLEIAGVPAAAVAKADSAARAKLNEAEQIRQDQIALIGAHKVEEVDFTDVIKAYRDAFKLASSKALKAEAERGVRVSSELQLIWVTHQTQVAETSEKYYKEILELQKAKEPVAPTFAMTGYVDTVGPLWKRPGSYKLLMGGKIVGFLRLKEGDEQSRRKLNYFYERYVGINGTVIEDPDGWEGYSVVVVDEIVPLNPKK